MPEDKLPIPQFAAKIKAKYPEYRDINDTLLTQKIVEKYPEYRDMVDLSGLEVKKKEDGSVPSQTGGQVGTGVPPSGGDKWKDFSFMPQNKKAFESDLDAHDPLLDAQRRATILKEKPTEGGFEAFTKASQQSRDINNVVSRNGFVGDNFVSKVIGDDPNKYSIEQLQEKTKDNKTAQASISGIADKRKVEEAVSTTTDPYRAAIKYYTGKENEQQNDIDDAKKGEYVSQFLNNPNVIQLAKTNPDFETKYKEAKFNWMNDFPQEAQKQIAQKIGQHLEDNGEASILYNNPGKEKSDKAVTELVKSGDLDPHEEAIYEQNIRPDLGTFNSMMWGSKIPTADIVNTFSKSMERNGGNILEGIRDVTDKISGGTISALGESADDHQKRILEDIHSTPQVEPSSEAKKIGLDVVDMVGFAVPAVLGEMAGVPSMATLGFQFYGTNKKTGMELFPEDKGKQDAYAALTTGIDLVAGQKLPFGEAGQMVRGLLGEVAEGKITQQIAKNKYANFVSSWAKNSVNGANAIELMKVGHNAADAVFGGKNFDVEEQAKQVLQQYPKDLLAMSFFGGVAAAKHFKPTEAVEAKPLSAEKLFDEKLPLDIKYKDVKVKDMFSEQEQTMSASKGKRLMEKQYNILDKLINCLT